MSLLRIPFSRRLARVAAAARLAPSGALPAAPRLASASPRFAAAQGARRAMVLPADRQVHTSARCSAAVTAEEMERVIDEGLDAETAGSERRQLEEDDSTAADMGELQDDVMFRAVCQSALTAAESDGFLISSFPKEIVFLSGAPGAGKRSMAAWVSSTRGFTAPAIQMKELLHRHGHDVEAARIDDLIAFEELLMELMSGNYADGVVVIGFPRTAGQVAALKVLQQMFEVERRERSSFEPVPRAVFRFVELYVEPRKSISRQMDAPGKRWSKTEAEERHQTNRDHGKPTLDGRAAQALCPDPIDVDIFADLPMLVWLQLGPHFETQVRTPNTASVAQRRHSLACLAPHHVILRRHANLKPTPPRRHRW